MLHADTSMMAVHSAHMKTEFEQRYSDETETASVSSIADLPNCVHNCHQECARKERNIPCTHSKHMCIVCNETFRITHECVVCLYKKKELSNVYIEALTVKNPTDHTRHFCIRCNGMFDTNTMCNICFDYCFA